MEWLITTLSLLVLFFLFSHKELENLKILFKDPDSYSVIISLNLF